MNLRPLTLIYPLRILHLEVLVFLLWTSIVSSIAVTGRLTGLSIARWTAVIPSVLIVLLRRRLIVLVLLICIVGIVLRWAMTPGWLTCPSRAVKGLLTSAAAATGGEAATESVSTIILWHVRAREDGVLLDEP